MGMMDGQSISSAQRPALGRHSSGKERDVESGLDYFGARYFSGAQGRFTSTDPLLKTIRPTNPQSLNRYAYTLNNPLRYIDRNGLYEEDVHRDLTVILAFAVGFDPATAAAIGAADQQIDDDFKTRAWAGYDARRDYHFTTAERRNAMWASFESSGSTRDLGAFLHVEQDSYSHAGYGPRTGHAIARTRPDKTYNDPGKANIMARDTYNRLSVAADRLGASGSRVSWAKVDALVGSFNKAKTSEEKNKILGQLRDLIKKAQEEERAEKKKKDEVSR